MSSKLIYLSCQVAASVFNYDSLAPSQVASVHTYIIIFATRWHHPLNKAVHAWRPLLRCILQPKGNQVVSMSILTPQLPGRTFHLCLLRSHGCVIHCVIFVWKQSTLFLQGACICWQLWRSSGRITSIWFFGREAGRLSFAFSFDAATGTLCLSGVTEVILLVIARWHHPLNKAVHVWRPLRFILQPKGNQVVSILAPQLPGKTLRLCLLRSHGCVIHLQL